MKFKAGDKVRVRKDLEVDKVYGNCTFVSRMTHLKGKIVTIKEVNYDGTYRIEGDCYHWTDEMFALLQITIDDLKFGDILTLRNDERYVYVDRRMFGESEGYYCDCDEVEYYYNNDLKHKSNNKYDVIKIEREGQIIFEHKDVREMTIEEISEALGYEVKVVKR